MSNGKVMYFIQSGLIKMMLNEILLNAVPLYENESILS